MGRKFNSIEYKTAICVGCSVLLHAGLIYYVASTQFGGKGEGGNGEKESETISFDVSQSNADDSTDSQTEAAVNEPVAETKLPEKIETPKETVVDKDSAVSVPEKEVSKPKLATTLPKKEEQLPAPAPKNEKTSVIDPQTKEKIAVTQPQENAPEEKSMEVTSTVDEEARKSNEQLVEQIMSDQKQPESQEPEVTPTPVPAAPAAAPAKEDEDTAGETIQAQQGEGSPSAESQTSEKGAAGAESTESSAQNLPVKQDSDLKPMPGNKDPQYSKDDRLARRQGEVKFMAEVSKAGSLSNIRLLKSSGHKSLDLSAYRAFKNFRYQPGQQSFVVKSFVFTLKGPAQQLPSRLAIRGEN